MLLRTMYLSEFIGKATADYLMFSNTGKKRFNNLYRTLLTISTISDEYKEFEEMVNKRAEELKCDRKKLRLEMDFPDFKW